MITHAGMNSTLECLANGVPMLAIPVAHDQMHLAQLIAWKGAGRRLPLEEVTAGRVREELQEVLNDGRYRETATRIRGEIAAADGLNRAAALVEEAIRTGAPVLRPN
jgi:UDP:flavonoid glycosyltransferase YjiC (YdhE family)